jgi:hypothetical protein
VGIFRILSLPVWAQRQNWLTGVHGAYVTFVRTSVRRQGNFLSPGGGGERAQAWWLLFELGSNCLPMCIWKPGLTQKLGLLASLSQGEEAALSSPDDIALCFISPLFYFSQYWGLSSGSPTCLVGALLLESQFTFSVCWWGPFFPERG